MNYGRVNSGSERLDATLQQKTFTPDRFPFDKHATTYGIDGFSEVIINAPENFSAENIKKDVTIAGVVGTYEGSGGSGGDSDPEGEFFKALVCTNGPMRPANAPAGLIKPGTLTHWPHYTNVGPDGLDLSNLAPVDGSSSIGITYLFQYYTVNNSKQPGGPVKLGNTKISMSYSYLTGLPDGEWVLYVSSFNGCKFLNDIVLKEANVPTGIISGSTFSDIAKFELSNINNYLPLTLTLPANITNINGYASVSGNSSAKLNLVMLATTPPTVEASYSLQYLNSITVPAGTLEAYQTATNWSQFADIMVEATTENTEAGA